MIILDHNIINEQMELLRRHGIKLVKIGADIGLPSWDDEQEILCLLHRSKHATFFTRDADFFRYRLCHKQDCLVVVDMPESETAKTIQRFLRLPTFRTKAQRCGKVIRLSPRSITWWELGDRRQQHLIW